MNWDDEIMKLIRSFDLNQKYLKSMRGALSYFDAKKRRKMKSQSETTKRESIRYFVFSFKKLFIKIMYFIASSHTMILWCIINVLNIIHFRKDAKLFMFIVSV